MKPCKHLDYNTQYIDCKIIKVPGYHCVRYWERGPTWTEGPLNEGNPVAVQFCGKGRGRINGIFQCYSKSGMSCYEPGECPP